MYDQYAYDELGQLIREDNRDANKSYTYSYDSRGNILEKKTYAQQQLKRAYKTICMLTAKIHALIILIPRDILE